MDEIVYRKDGMEKGGCYGTELSVINDRVKLVIAKVVLINNYKSFIEVDIP